MTPLVIGFVQINDGLTWARRWRNFRLVEGSIGRRHEAADDEAADEYSIFPYSVGVLQAYAQQHAAKSDGLTFLPPLFKHVSIPRAIAHLESADVVGFSSYVWNINRSLTLARALKARCPQTLIVFGGPQIPDNAEAFLREHLFIDIVCHGEGEATFLEILEHAQGRNWDDVSGVSYLEPSDAFVTHPRAARLKDLDEIPSPYLEGVFDPLIRAHPNEKWIMLWETNRGCPFSCAFCDWGSATASKIFQFDFHRLVAELEWYGRRQGEFIFCCDANFGILPRDYDLAQAAATIKAEYGFPRSLSVQNTKNATERAYLVQKLLADAGMNTAVTLSLQSVDPAALRNVKRENIAPAHFERLQTRYTREQIDTYTDMILALPGETYESFTSGVSRVIRGGQHNRILFYNLSILPNAAMGNPDYQALHGMSSVPQRITTIHSDRDRVTGAAEFLRTVVSTATMPAANWRRAKTFWWMTDLIYFDRLLQIPIVLLTHLYHIEYHEVVEAFLAADKDRFPITAEIVAMFRAKAERIQRGEPEWIADDDWLRILWPADQFALITLVANGTFDEFYSEAHGILAGALEARSVSFDHVMLVQALELNRLLFKTPFVSGSATVETSWNIWSVYQGVLTGQPAPLLRNDVTLAIDRDQVAWRSLSDWCEHILFSYNKRSSYLHAVRPTAGGGTLEICLEGVAVASS